MAKDWIQFPLKNDLAAADILFVRQFEYERTQGSDIAFDGRTVVGINPAKTATIAPVMPGEIRFVPNDLATARAEAAKLASGGVPNAIPGEIHLHMPGGTRDVLLDKLDASIVVPSTFIYAGVEIPGSAWTLIKTRLGAVNVLDRDGKILKESDAAALPAKLDLFLEGIAAIEAQPSDELAVVSVATSPQGQAKSLVLVFGSILDGYELPFKDKAYALRASTLARHWPIPASYFYRAVNKNPETWKLLAAQSPDTHPLKAPMTSTAWRRVPIGLMSWRDYPAPTSWGPAPKRRGPSPAPGIDSYFLEAEEFSPVLLLRNPVPASADIFLKPTHVTIRLKKTATSAAVKIRPRAQPSVPLGTSHVLIANEGISEFIHESFVGTYSVIALGTRKDTKNFMEGAERIGLSPSVRPAVPVNIYPTAQMIKDALSAKPLWIFLAGHFASYLYSQKSEVKLFFGESGIVIENQGTSTTVPKSSFDLSNLHAISFGGCSLLASYSVGVNGNTWNFVEFFNPGGAMPPIGTLPVIFAWRATTDDDMGAKQMATDDGFFHALQKIVSPALPLTTSLTNHSVPGRTIPSAIDTWLAVAKKKGIVEAAAMDINGEIYGFTYHKNPPVHLGSIKGYI